MYRISQALGSLIGGFLLALNLRCPVTLALCLLFMGGLNCGLNLFPSEEVKTQFMVVSWSSDFIDYAQSEIGIAIRQQSYQLRYGWAMRSTKGWKQLRELQGIQGEWEWLSH